MSVAAWIAVNLLRRSAVSVCVRLLVVTGLLLGLTWLKAQAVLRMKLIVHLRPFVTCVAAL